MIINNVEIILIPNDENDFLNELIKYKKALREYEFIDGQKDSNIWDAKRITLKSNLISNIITTHYFRKNKDKIKKITISILYDEEKNYFNEKEYKKICNYLKNSNIEQNNKKCFDLLNFNNASLTNFMTVEELKKSLNYKEFFKIYDECVALSEYKDLEIRKHVDISRSTHSDLISGNRQLTKERAIQYAFGFRNKEICLKFIKETIGGLGDNLRDKIVEYFINENNFDVWELDYYLKKFDCKGLFKDED